MTMVTMMMMLVGTVNEAERRQEKVCTLYSFHGTKSLLLNIGMMMMIYCIHASSVSLEMPATRPRMAVAAAVETPEIPFPAVVIREILEILEIHPRLGGGRIRTTGRGWENG